MTLPWPEGNRPSGLFPRLLLGLSAKMNLDRDRVAYQLLEQRLDLPVKFLERRLVCDRVAVDEEGQGSHRPSALLPHICGQFHLVEERSAALEERIDLLLELPDRRLALDPFAIDEEGRRRIHLQDVAGVFLDRKSTRLNSSH